MNSSNHQKPILLQSKLLIENLRAIRTRSNQKAYQHRNLSQDLHGDNIKVPPKAKPLSQKISLQDILKLHPKTNSNCLNQEENRFTVKQNRNMQPTLHNDQEDEGPKTDRQRLVREPSPKTINITIQVQRPQSRKPPLSRQTSRKSKSIEFKNGLNQLLPQEKTLNLDSETLQSKEDKSLIRKGIYRTLELNNLIPGEITLKNTKKKSEENVYFKKTFKGYYESLPSQRESLENTLDDKLFNNYDSEAKKTLKRDIIRLIKENCHDKIEFSNPKNSYFAETLSQDKCKVFAAALNSTILNSGENLPKYCGASKNFVVERQGETPKSIERPTIKRHLLVPKIKQRSPYSIKNHMRLIRPNSTTSMADKCLDLYSKEFAENFRSKILNNIFKLPLSDKHSLTNISFKTLPTEMIGKIN